MWFGMQALLTFTTIKCFLEKGDRGCAGLMVELPIVENQFQNQGQDHMGTGVMYRFEEFKLT